MKLWLIAKSNISRKKGNTLILFILITMSVMLMYTSLTVLTNVNGYLSKKNDESYGAQVSILATPNYQEELLDIIEHQEGYKECSIYSKLFYSGAGKVNNISNKLIKEETMSVLFGKINEKHSVNNWEIIDKGETFKENSIVVPMYLKVGRGYKTGDKMSMELGNETKEFEVYGFIEDTMLTIPSNISIYSCLVSDKMYEEIETNELVKSNYIYDIRLNSEDMSSSYENELTKTINEKMTYPDFGTYFIINYKNMKLGTLMFSNILMIILAAFAGIISIISIFVIRFNITTAIEENMTDIGIMQASGYTSRQLKNSYLFEYVVIAVAGSAAGIFISRLAGTYVAKIVSQCIGFWWKMPVDVTAAVAVIVFMMLFVSIIVSLSVKKIKRITTLDALRGGIETHNFKKNYIPLENSIAGLNTSIGLKNLFHNIKQNIAIVIVVTLLAFACVLMLITQYNFSGDSKALINLIGIEKANVEVSSVNRTNEEFSEMSKELEAREDIDRTVLFTNMSVTFFKDNHEMSVEADIYSDFNRLSTKIIYEGREPERDNEIVISKVVADNFGVETGDSISVKVGDNSASYVIVGISQHLSNLGIKCRLTLPGALRISDNVGYAGILVYLNQDKNSTVNVINELKEKYNDESDIRISNIDDSFQTVIGTFTGSLAALCVTFIVVTLVVVILIIVLIIRMKLLKEKRMLGVFKAIGYTTNQLVWQMVMSIAPVIAVGGIAGAALGELLVNKIFILMLGFCGIQSVNLESSILIIAGVSVSIIVLAFAASALVAYRIRKIEPYNMIIND